MRRAAALSVVAGLLWIAQAAVVAHALGKLLVLGQVDALVAAAIFASLGVLRTLLVYWSETLAQTAADTVIQEARQTIVLAEAQRTDDNPFGGAGAIAALASEKLELLGPFLTRYGLARARVMVLPTGKARGIGPASCRTGRTDRERSMVPVAVPHDGAGCWKTRLDTGQPRIM